MSLLARLRAWLDPYRREREALERELALDRFYEDDEPAEEIVAAFKAASKTDASGLPIRLVDVVLKTLADRSGFDHWWDDLDVEVQLSIVDELEKVVRAVIEPEES